MKITIPENISEITLEQYLQFNEVVNREDVTDEDLIYNKVSIFTGVKLREVRQISLKELKEINSLIDVALTTDAPFKQRFKIDGIEFGFIPNLDKINKAEWADLMNYQSDESKLNNLMAILFRPIVESSLGTYVIENYIGTEKHAKTMLKMPLNYVKGATGFFLTLLKELHKHTQKCMEQEQARAIKQ